MNMVDILEAGAVDQTNKRCWFSLGVVTEAVKSYELGKGWLRNVRESYLCSTVLLLNLAQQILNMFCHREYASFPLISFIVLHLDRSSKSRFYTYIFLSSFIYIFMEMKFIWHKLNTLQWHSVYSQCSATITSSFQIFHQGIPNPIKQSFLVCIPPSENHWSVLSLWIYLLWMFI